MWENINQLDTEIFIFLNGLGSPYLDVIMRAFSNKFLWIPLYLYLIYRIYDQKKSKFLIWLGIVILVVSCTDQITSNLMKPFFERLRPCKDPLLSDVIAILDKCRGNFGFASGHAANSMGLAIIYFLIERSIFSKGLIIWALVVGYSRIYLGMHYPGDVLVGWSVGILAALLIYTLATKWLKAYLAVP